MSANPSITPAVASTISPEVIQSVEEVLTVGLTMIFPAAGPIIGLADTALKRLIPYIIGAINGQKYTLSDLKAMQADLNSLGGSFPNVPGYSNAFASAVAGTAPGAAPGVPASSVPASATINLGPGRVITISADTIPNLLKLFGVINPEALVI